MALSEEERKEKDKARRKAYREANPEKAKAQSKAWREANPEKVKATRKAWSESNSGKLRLARKVWNEANMEKLILSKLKAKGITDPPEELIELMVARREANKTLKKMKKWRKENDPTITDVQGIEHQNEIPDGLP
jgi:hypothetical protein